MRSKVRDRLTRHFVQPGMPLRQPGELFRQPAALLRQPGELLRQPDHIKSSTHRCIAMNPITTMIYSCNK